MWAAIQLMLDTTTPHITYWANDTPDLSNIGIVGLIILAVACIIAMLSSRV